MSTTYNAVDQPNLENLLTSYSATSQKSYVNSTLVRSLINSYYKFNLTASSFVKTNDFLYLNSNTPTDASITGLTLNNYNQLSFLLTTNSSSASGDKKGSYFGISEGSLVHNPSVQTSPSTPTVTDTAASATISASTAIAASTKTTVDTPAAATTTSGSIVDAKFEQLPEAEPIPAVSATATSASSTWAAAISAFRSAGTITEITSQRNTNGGGATVSVPFTFPVAPSAGSLVIFCMSWRGNATVSAVPFGAQFSVVSDGADIDSAIYYKIADGTEGTAWTFTLSASVKSTGVATEYTGMDAGALIGRTSSATGTGTAGDTGSTQPLLYGNQLVIAVFGTIGTGTWSGYPGEYIQVGQVSSTGGSQGTRNTTAMISTITPPVQYYTMQDVDAPIVVDSPATSSTNSTTAYTGSTQITSDAQINTSVVTGVQYASHNPDKELLLKFDRGSRALSARLKSGTADLFVSYPYTPSSTIDTIVAEYERTPYNKITLYVNGALIGSSTLSSSINLFPAGGDGLKIFSNGVSCDPLETGIRYLGIYNKALTLTEISNIESRL